MDGVFRFILRLLLIPTAVLVAVTAQGFIILFGEWQLGAVLAGIAGPQEGVDVIAAVLAASYLTIVLLGLTWAIGTIGILFSEAFAARSWIFHVSNGAGSLVLATRLFPMLAGEPAPMEDLLYILGAGFAGGLLYWLIAGWSAGFWKPVFSPRPVGPVPAASGPVASAPAAPGPATPGPSGSGPDPR